MKQRFASYVYCDITFLNSVGSVGTEGHTSRKDFHINVGTQQNWMNCALFFQEKNTPTKTLKAPNNSLGNTAVVPVIPVLHEENLSKLKCREPRS